MVWKRGEISWPWANHAATKTAGGMERKGNASSGTQDARLSARNRDARCAALSSRRLMSGFSSRRRVGGGLDMVFIRHQLHQSSFLPD